MRLTVCYTANSGITANKQKYYNRLTSGCSAKLPSSWAKDMASRSKAQNFTFIEFVYVWLLGDWGGSSWDGNSGESQDFVPAVHKLRKHGCQFDGEDLPGIGGSRVSVSNTWLQSIEFTESRARGLNTFYQAHIIVLATLTRVRDVCGFWVRFSGCVHFVGSEACKTRHSVGKSQCPRRQH